MITVFGEENNNFAPAIRYGKKIPGYYATRDGKIYSSKSQMFISLFVGTSSYLSASLSLPRNFFPDHDFYVAKHKKNSFNLKIEVHRLIAETFIPIDENPPIPMEDWINTPESAKQFIRDSAIVDHIDSDHLNNSVENLRWVTPKQNNSHRKKQELDAT